MLASHRSISVETLNLVHKVEYDTVAGSIWVEVDVVQVTR